MSDVPARVVGFFAIAAVILGASWAVAQWDPVPSAAAQAVEVREISSLGLVAPGTQATFALLVTNGGGAEQTLALSLRAPPGFEGRFVPSALTLAPGESRGAFLTVSVPDGANGAATLVAEARGETQRGSVVLPLAVGRGSAGPLPGESATAFLTGRTLDGRVFWTSSARVQDAVVSLGTDVPAFLRHEAYEQFPRGDLLLRMDPDARPAGLRLGILDMRAGESRTFIVPPELAFDAGPVPITLSRFEEFARVRTVDPNLALPAGAFAELPRVGDAIVRESHLGAGQATYRVASVTAASVHLVLDLSPGDRLALGDRFSGLGAAWEVRSVDGRATISFEAPPGTFLTLYPPLAGQTVVDALTETTVRLDTAPPVGFEFPTPGYGCAQTGRVTAVTETEVVVLAPRHELCGVTVAFDVDVRSFR
ncbi:MAG TPA: FKBP-type peptidyl-prolyl cis-trans isomerase [Candidatus Thermoplasmatota archaeon]|nr:FKBP-type peptidyl-prolyl cis-trans isomerase [Candidatus Thermoplasmatota archaeon]